VSRLLVATTNPGKQREFRRLLAALPADVVTPDQLGLDLEVEEPHETYAENASVKADAYARRSGMICLADDSGIEVAALGWGPGVRSARWAGEKGREADRLLEALRDVEDRRARMVCALAVAVPRDLTRRSRFSRRRARGSWRRRASRCRRLRIRPGLRRRRRTDHRRAARGTRRIGFSHRGRAVAAATPPAGAAGS
jgi:non-canonical purine NTP pyrophosphatase (RdgB/HAM1 family)